MWLNFLIDFFHRLRVELGILMFASVMVFFYFIINYLVWSYADVVRAAVGLRWRTTILFYYYFSFFLDLFIFIFSRCMIDGIV